MPRAAIAGRKASAFGLTALVLLPVLLRAQAASARPPEKPRIVDMGTYQVDAPGKNWQIETMERDSAVMFSKFREGLLDYQGRVDMITVQSVIVNIYGWRSTEEEVIADYASRRGIAAMCPREGWEPFECEGKRVRAIIGKGGGPEGKVKSIFLFHFPGAGGALGLVAVSLRDAEYGQHIRSDASIGEAAELADRGLHTLVKIQRQGMGVLGIELCFKLEQTLQASDE